MKTVDEVKQELLNEISKNIPMGNYGTVECLTRAWCSLDSQQKLSANPPGFLESGIGVRLKDTDHSQPGLADVGTR